ncbi:MAG: hypothetical protein A2Z14_03930 [Chloroflexi bacterium RBG_16_48_8]|nr:MAG: hypothetical protein A2Z14_03930 [Chloroflexi bacterium RBG_16_48_8]
MKADNLYCLYRDSMIKKNHMIEASFPRLYAAYVAQFKEDLSFWQELAHSSGSPILELGCGPGRVLLALAKKGITVTGLDSDEEMLQWVRSQATQALLQKITLIHGDMRSLSLPNQYPLVIVPCNTFAYFNDAAALQVLAGIKRHLTSNGQLAMAIPNPAQYTDFDAEQIQMEISETEPISDFIEPISQHPVQVYAYEELDRERNILQVLWAFDELFPDGQVKRLQHPVSYTLRSLEEMLELLSYAQMGVKHVFGDYQRGSLDQNSHEMIIVAANTTRN